DVFRLARGSPSKGCLPKIEFGMALPESQREAFEERPPLRLLQEAFAGEASLEQPRDLYIQHLLNALPPELIASLTPDQYRQLKDALYRYHRRHLIDVRGTIPLFFGHYYFVFLFGRDRRQQEQAVPFERRRTSRWHRLVGWLVMLTILAILLLGALGFAQLTRLLGR
ncbi:MAG: hypothetical protein NZL85_03005, partial [Fimbriimonadales bacterium]|nr:hypothetical protein [Fimbriimonadales bacterium]